MTALSALRTAVYTATRISSTDPSLTSTTLTALINRALKFMATEHDWPWLYAESTISAVVGTRDYSWPTGATRINWLAIDKYDPFTPVQRKVALRYSDTDRTGRPSMFTDAGHGTIRIAPYPNQAYTINIGYFQDEAVLSGDSDEPLLPDMYDDVLVARTMILIGQRRNDKDLIREGEDLYNDWIRVIGDNVPTSSQKPRTRTRTDWAV